MNPNIRKFLYVKSEHADFSIPALAVSVSALALSAYTSAHPHLRHAIPDPIDIMDHFGNIGPSLLVGSVVGASTMFVVETQNTEPNKVDDTPKKLKRALIGAGLVVGALVNLVAESKYGASIKDHGFSNTPDVIDWVYGTAFTAIGARAAARFHR